MEVENFTTRENTDRRQAKTPVDFERRAGIDRRVDDENLIDYCAYFVPSVKKAIQAEKTKDENKAKSVGLLGVAALTASSDLRDFSLAGMELKNVFANGTNALPPKDYQHALSFFRGTLCEKLLKNETVQAFDKSLFETKFGEKIMDICKTGIDDLGKVDLRDGISAVSYKFEGNFLQKTLGRALLRVPVLSVGVNSLLEIPEIVKAVNTRGDLKDKSKATLKQIIKSLDNIAVSSLVVGVAGAIFAPMGFAASLVGIGLGGIISNVLIKNINNKIKDIF